MAKNGKKNSTKHEEKQKQIANKHKSHLLVVRSSMNCFWSKQQLNVQFLFYIASDAAVALLQLRSFFIIISMMMLMMIVNQVFLHCPLFLTFTSWFLSALIYTRIVHMVICRIDSTHIFLAEVFRGNLRLHGRVV